MNEIEEHGQKLLATQQLMKPFVDRWVIALGLDRWKKVDINYKALPPEETDGGFTTHAECGSDWTRLQYWVNFYLSNLFEKNERELEELAIHEFCHALVAETRRNDGEKRTKEEFDHEERVVTTLVMCFLRVRKMALEGLLP